MKFLKNKFKFSNPEWAISIAFVALLLAGYSEAASVYSYSCTESSRCVIKVEEGMVGDHIKILNEKARPIASGRILKRNGAYADVSITKASQTVRKGYPVIVSMDSRSSSLQWAASFSGPAD